MDLIIGLIWLYVMIRSLIVMGCLIFAFLRWLLSPVGWLMGRPRCASAPPACEGARYWPRKDPRWEAWDHELQRRFGQRGRYLPPPD